MEKHETNRTRRAKIDLSHIDLPGLHKSILFTFIDPVFAWSTCADKLSGEHNLYFKYKALKHPTSGDLLYGSSVQNGMIMKKACERLPRFGLVSKRHVSLLTNITTSHRTPLPTGPALFGISWDAANATKRRSYTPILISVGNTDYCGLNSCVCIGYLPLLPLSAGDESKDEGKLARHELVQGCIGAIIDVIEDCAQRGFKCMLNTRWILQPRPIRHIFMTTHTSQHMSQRNARRMVFVPRAGPHWSWHKGKV